MATQCVLLVDDTPSLLKLGVAIFESGGYDVATATNGVEALTVLSQRSVDLIVTDILMPEMDGYSLCFNIRNSDAYKSIPIIIYSATYTSSSDEALGMNIGADLFMRKPASMEQLLAAAKQVIGTPRHGAVVEQSQELSEVMKIYNSRLIEKLEEKNQELQQANRLYTFISAINQNIVHARHEAELLDNACDIAINIGRYKLAWIGMLGDNGRLSFVSIRGDDGAVSELRDLSGLDFTGPSLAATSTGKVLRTGVYAVSNDVQNDPALERWRDAFIRQEIRANISLPLIKSGTVVGVFVLNSTTINCFDHQEITLLQEAAGDISFALEVFELERHREKMRVDLEHSKIRLTQAQAMAHFGSWELSFESGTAIWSEEACRIYGLDTDKHIQTYSAWMSFIHPDDLDEVLRLTKLGEESLQSYGFHHRIIRTDGRVRHIYSEAHFEFDGNKRPVGLYGIVHDVTEIREAEIALSQSEANMRLIMDLIPQSIFAKGQDGKYLFVNKSFAALYGLSPEQMLNRTVIETIPHVQQAAAFMEQDRKVLASGVMNTIPEAAFTDHDGNVRLFRTVKLPFTVANTHERAVLGIAEDITEQKRAEDERNRIVADIMQRNVDLEQFSYIVSHNLRAPVANIMGLTELFALSETANPEEKEIAGLLSMSAEKLDNVVRDLNQILQVRQGVNYQRTTVHLSDLLQDIRTNIADLIKTENVTLTGDFSQLDELVTIKSYMHSVFYNLITNSIKYRRANVAPVIEISSIRHKDAFELVFRDNGLGLDIKKVEKQLFGLYKRFHMDIDGKGMGLYMVKTQVQLLGGRINVTSEVNKGTEFRLTLPMNDKAL